MAQSILGEVVVDVGQRGGDLEVRRPRLRIATVPILLILAACVHERSGLPAASAEPLAVPATSAASPVISDSPSAAQPPSAPSSGAAASAPAAEPPAAPADPQATAPPAPARTTSHAPSIRSGSTADKVSPSVPATTSRALPGLPTVAASKPVSPATVARVPALDLNALEQRLRDTHAIGVFTKLSLKNQVDDLLTQFKAFHQGHSQITLAQLRRKYEVLLLKVVSVLQDDDPDLASAVSSSREAIWGILTDPKKFADI